MSSDVHTFIDKSSAQSETLRNTPMSTYRDRLVTLTPLHDTVGGLNEALSSPASRTFISPVALDRASKSVGPLYARTGVQILNSRRTGAMGHTWIAELLSSAAVEQQRPQPPGPQRLRTIASLPQ